MEEQNINENYYNDRKRYEFLMYRRNRTYTLYGILLSVIGLTTILTKELILNFVDRTFSISFIIIGAFSLAIGIGLLLYRYLQVGLGKISTIESTSYDKTYRKELEELKLDLLRLKKKTGTINETENLNKLIDNVINNTLTEDFILSKIEDAYSEKAIEQSKLRKIYSDFENLAYRIDGELARLRRSANLNLVIGTLTTSLAIFALGYEVFFSELEFTNTVKLLSHYLPRISLVVFIEIFAFFFLKLYKTSLDDIKYFNNEKTNIDFKLISLKTAMYQENNELIKLTIEELVKTERNFKLKKDETTVELEKMKSNNENNKLLSQILGKLTDKL